MENKTDSFRVVRINLNEGVAQYKYFSTREECLTSIAETGNGWLQQLIHPDPTDNGWYWQTAMNDREQLEEIKKLLRARPRSAETGFLDAKAAAAYCGMSRGTFDKYRYKTAVKIKGYRIGGKVLYKTEDLDSFIKLYELKSGGLA